MDHRSRNTEDSSIESNADYDDSAQEISSFPDYQGRTFKLLWWLSAWKGFDFIDIFYLLLF